jgi:hypothetical protein
MKPRRFFYGFQPLSAKKMLAATAAAFSPAMVAAADSAE